MGILSPIKWRQRHDMTIVDRDAKPKLKQTKLFQTEVTSP